MTTSRSRSLSNITNDNLNRSLTLTTNVSIDLIFCYIILYNRINGKKDKNN